MLNGQCSLLNIENFVLNIEHFNFQKVRVEGLEPPCLAAPDPKSGMSTNFTTPAEIFAIV
jgi:hypothetical protein